MHDLQTILLDNHNAVADFSAVARDIPENQWTLSLAPGKWSPAQITEHVAIAYEISHAALTGNFPGSTPPRFVRPLIRKFFLNPVLKNGRFPKRSKAPKVFQPTVASIPADALLSRLNASAEKFVDAVKAEAAAGRNTIDHPFFGRIELTDYLRLQVIHTLHHLEQLPKFQNA